MEALLTDSEVRIQIADNLPDKVQAQFGVVLEPEVKMIGEF
jgi:UDP-N-acetylenolpyruvoylglucosamine reductase